MKEWTKIFLNKEIKRDEQTLEGSSAIENSVDAEKTLGLPKELWLELSTTNKLIDSLKDNIETAFMAGVAVGYAEKNDLIK